MTEDKNEIETLAEELGWNPNWEGPEEERVEAADYIRRQQEILRRSSDDITSLKGTVDSMKSQMQEMAANQTRDMTRALEAQKARLEEEREKAVEEGDTAKFKQVDQQIKVLDQPDSPNEIQKRFTDGLTQFRKDNEWYEKDVGMTTFANNAGATIAQMNPGIDPDAFYRQVADAVREQYPQKFAKPSNKPTEVSGDRPAKPRPKSKWDALVAKHPELDGIFAGFVKKGVWKDTKEDRERYAEQVGEI